LETQETEDMQLQEVLAASLFLPNFQTNEDLQIQEAISKSLLTPNSSSENFFNFQFNEEDDMG
jgi:hypothetical protein